MSEQFGPFLPLDPGRVSGLAGRLGSLGVTSTGIEIPIELLNRYGGSIACKIAFYDEGELHEINEGIDRQDGMLIHVTTNKDLNAPAGAFTITMHDRRRPDLGNRRVSEVLKPMDLMTVSFRRGNVFLGAMVGVVSAIPTVSEDVDPTSGARIRQMTISGFDMGKLLLAAGIFYFKDAPLGDPKTYWEKGFRDLTEAGVFPGGPRWQIIQTVLENRLYEFMSLNYQRGDGFANLRKIVDYYLGETYGDIMVPMQYFDQEQNLWSLFSSLCDKPWTELFVDTWPTDGAFRSGMVPHQGATHTGGEPFDGVTPVIVMRETPFDEASWNALPRFIIDNSVIHHVEVGGEPTIYNLYYARPEGQGGYGPLANQAIAGKPILYEESVKRHGYRPLVAENKAIPLDVEEVSRMPDIQTRTAYLTNQLYNWFALTGEFLSGTIVVQGNPLYRVGTRLLRKLPGGDAVEFYIEGVTHSFSMFGEFKTTLRVTRGLDVQKNRWPKPLELTAGMFLAQQDWVRRK